MAGRAFVDTSGWYALIDRRDPTYRRARAAVARVRRSGSRLVTTDYVVDETCTLLKARLGSVGAARLLDLLGGTAALNWQWIGPERF